MNQHRPQCPTPLEIWQLFFQGYDTMTIAKTARCHESQIYNLMGSTRGGRMYRRAKANG